MTGATRNGYYDAHIFCCINERKPGHKRGSCAQRGGETLRNYLKGRLKEAGLKGRMRANACG